MAKNETIQLADAVTSNSSTTAVAWPGGLGNFVCQGTFDTCTVKLEVSVDGGTTYLEFDSTNTTVTAAAVVAVTAGRGLYRVTVSSVGGSTSVSAYLTPAESE